MNHIPLWRDLELCESRNPTARFLSEEELRNAALAIPLIQRCAGGQKQEISSSLEDLEDVSRFLSDTAPTLRCAVETRVGVGVGVAACNELEPETRGKACRDDANVCRPTRPVAIGKRQDRRRK